MGRRLPVAIGVISSGQVDLDTVASMLVAVQEKAVRWVTLHRRGPYLDDARNAICRTFMDDPQFRECSALLMVDSDVIFTPADVAKLFDAGEDVVSGIYHSVHGSLLLPVVHEWTEIDEEMVEDGGLAPEMVGRKTLAPIISWSDGWPMWPSAGPEHLDPLIKVSAVGAGFLMIRRTVLEELRQIHGEPLPYFDEPVLDGIHVGEDIAFCLRCADAGFDVWAHRGVQVGHYKPIRLGGSVR